MIEPLLKPNHGRETLTPYQRGRQRKRLWNERENVCAICRFPIMSINDMELDHKKIQPMGCAKDDSDENQQLTHSICNRKRGSRRNV